MSVNIPITKNFVVGELASEVEWANLSRLATQLEVLRKELGGMPIIITSGWRSVEHNRRVGGARKSQHLYGRAADIKVAGLPPDFLYNFIAKLIKEGKMTEGGLGLYPTWVHYDIRGTKARWKR